MKIKKKSFKTLETDQLKIWEGSFGDQYVERNSFEEWKLTYGKNVFKKIIGGLEIESILEVGSNIGLNLIYLSNLLNNDIDIYAIEPNKKAYKNLCNNNKINLRKAWNVSAYDIPLKERSIDLVFTSGVLIHTSPDDLIKATDQIYRIAKKYILCIEYFSHDPIEVRYHNQSNLLFKRDFGKFYLDNYKQLKCLKYGFLWQPDVKVFDNMNWWLFKK